MSSNFDFLRLHLPDLHADALEAERLARTAPRASAFQCRFVLERTAHWLYANDPGLTRPYEDRLGAMLHEQSFKDNLPPGLFAKARAVYMLGNQAAHRSQRVTTRDSMRAIEDLFHLLYWVSRTYSPDASQHPRVRFNASAIPAAAPAPELSDARLTTLQQSYEQKVTELQAAAEARANELRQTEDERAALLAELKALKDRNRELPDAHDYNEEATRDQFIDLLLREAGWPLHQPGWHTEVPVQGMPDPTGQGFVDYVLWGEDGRPLALVEAKATRHSPGKGQHQATLYADCLERQHGRRPVIFLSNGYEHWIWDDRAGPPREIAGFLSPEELALLLWRGEHATDPAAVPIDPAIVERPYQQEAIRRVTEHFAAGHRRALVVMATGTGKTRTVIALVDVLMKANLVRRVLFLADRTNLLTQARRAFKRHLPRAAAVDLLQDPGGDGVVYLSTYPTMLNLVDRPREDGRRRFGPGFFDLVITDEAHRSIYKRYGDLFRWFDGRLVGLTATPRAELHRDTYRVFELDQKVPTFAYELEDAVADGYLVPPRGRNVPFRFLRQGITYNELSEEQREAYEDALYDEETRSLPDRVEARALNEWLFNLDTIDKVIDYLMENGLKVEEGSRLGKTIVFARNHKHAELIVQRFDLRWPELRGRFCGLIDSQVDYAQDLLDAFSKRDQPPHVAVSVDMLDAGVDVPEVLNLVLFRAVGSRVKFQQMIGRGTRLCPDLLGPGLDKDHFLVLDLCGNYEFFSKDLPEDPAPLPVSVGERIVRQRARLLSLLPHEEGALASSLRDHLHAHVRGMDLDGFRVRPRRREVERLADRAAWDALPVEETARLAAELASLPTADGVDQHSGARQLDLLALRLQIGLLRPDRGFEAAADELRRVAASLLRKADSLPMIARQRALLEAVLQDPWWESLTLWRVEEARRALRELARFADRAERPAKVSDIEDELLRTEVADVALPRLQAAVDLARYRRKVEAAIRQNMHHTAVWKLHHNRPLTPADLDALEALLLSPDLAGGQAQLAAVLEGERLPVFVRRLVGLDEAELRAAFQGFLGARPWTATQIRFVDLIVGFLAKNGVMDPALLYEPPFSEAYPGGVDALFDDQGADGLVALLRAVNANAGWEGRRAG